MILFGLALLLIGVATGIPTLRALGAAMTAIGAVAVVLLARSLAATPTR
jgi:hypothetical protein